MDEMVGYAVVLLIISGLIYALGKQMKEFGNSQHIAESPLFRKQLNKRNIILAAALAGILVFYTLNIVSSLTIITTIQLSNTFTALGTLVSFSIYLYAKFAMRPRQLNKCGSFYQK